MTLGSSQNAQPPTRGLVAGKYQLLRPIGKGGMGTVWEGQHVTLQTKVAIKFIETEHAVSEDARNRFLKEAMAAATISSKHAIQIFDHGVTDEGFPYIVMEMLLGEPLEKRVERVGRMSIQDTARTLLQVSRALQKAHDRGIIHRDLKPDNVFIVRDADDGEEIAKVLDFGIAKMKGDGTNAGTPGITSSTKTGAVLGTPFYMSPEQARGLRNVDHRTDIWSLGVIAFRCVTGRLPFDGESVGDLLVKICTAPVPVPSQIAPGIPPGFDHWFLRTMEREPERRFASVTDQANELCYLAGIPAAPGMNTPPSNVPQTMHTPAHLTPNGMMRNPHHVPSGPHQPPSQIPSAYPQQNQAYGQPAAANTNSPFTSQHIAPPSGGKGKVIAGVIVGALLVGGAITAAVLYGERKQKRADETTATTVAPPPATSVVPEPKPVESKPAETTTTLLPIATTAAAAEPKKPGPAPVKTASKAGAGSPPPPKTVAAPPPPPPAPPPAPKPKNNDPGY